MTDRPGQSKGDNRTHGNESDRGESDGNESDRSESDGNESDRNESDRNESTATEEDEQPRRPQYVPPQEESFGWRGWLLVGVVVVSFLLVPGTILALPYAEGVIGSIGLSYRQAYLTLPMIPAILLGAIAVWAAVRSRTAD